jgi:dihydrofolate reductase
MARKVWFGCANSLDNFIAREDGGIDWLMWNEQVSDIMKTFWKNIDTVVYGRKTYEETLKMGMGGGPSGGIKSYVCSRMLTSVGEGFELARGEASEFLRKLKGGPGKDICIMSGGVLGASLLEAGLIDEVGVNIHPVLLGKGVPLFLPMREQINLELKEHRVLSNGCVYLLYRVKNAN